MANTSLLIATSSRSPAPQWTDDAADYQVLAEGVWCVPTLWYALFRADDLVAHELEDDDGGGLKYKTPVVFRRRVSARLRTARKALAKLPLSSHSWDALLDGLNALIDQAPAQMRYIVCGWHEIADLDAKRFQNESSWLLRFFAGERVQEATRRFEAACGFPLRKFKDPQEATSSDYDDEDWDRLDRLLGDAVPIDAPWHPTASKLTSLTAAVFYGDQDQIQETLAGGAKIRAADMVKAAGHEDVTALGLLLQQGGNPSSGAPGQSCLVRAFNSRKAVEEKVQMLLSHGADVNHHDPTYKVLVCCLRHGLTLAKEVVARSDPTTLRSFLDWSQTETCDEYVASCDISWKDEFVALVRDALSG